jgi:TRAP-type mannitol/chloroaromatic compound transport system permease small subunit
MVRILLRLTDAIDSFNRWIGKAAAWAIVIAILVSALNALSRHLLGITSNAWLELQWYLFGAVFMLCAAWAMQENEHVRIDVVSSRLGRRAREIIDMFGHLFFLFPFVALMLWLSVPFFLKAVASREMSPNDGGLLLWPAKGLILLGFAQLGLQWLSEVIKSGFRLRKMSSQVIDEVSK